MQGKEIRGSFLRYFEGKGHRIIPSSTLVPHNDPTLLFTNAGMVQFKRIFLGEETRPSPRAATVQKCLRAGGKHNDLENVGYTARHHTFFEMLGNFSFGDYFKEDAIFFAWDLLTKTYGLPRKDLWITIYKDDDEAFTLWKKIARVRPDRIVRKGEEDNFWAMGDVGPCGPCSEIIIDQGHGVGCGRPQCDINCDCDRFLELWNLVFMQYNRDPSGALVPLPKPSIDTGMGLERIASVLQGAKSNYETDLFVPIIDTIAALPPGDSPIIVKDKIHSHWAIADHARAMTFLIAEGVLPSNEGQGYVLRRIMRRASGHGKKLGLRMPFLHALSHAVIEVMGGAYPEMVAQGPFISETIKEEEEKFAATLDRGMDRYEHEVDALKKVGGNTFPGDVAFWLYATCGFPPDMTRDLVREDGLHFDEEGFQKEMDAHREKSRSLLPGAGSLGMAVGTPVGETKILPTRFTGYRTIAGDSSVVAIHRDGQAVTGLRQGEKGGVIVAETPFYAESGGQVGDRGTIEGGQGLFTVEDCQKAPGDLILHIGTVTKGALSVGDGVRLQVDGGLRSATAANHTATHLLHWALRSTLGQTARQAGSLVAPERFRFDFASRNALSGEQIVAIENKINARIRENHPVRTDEMPYAEALATGAMALFGEKYGDRVRVVRVGDFSTELCGGTHVRATGEIGLLIVTSESAIGSGMRRIEAVTGGGGLEAVRRRERLLGEAASLLGSGIDDLPDRIKKLLDEKKSLRKDLETAMKKLASGSGRDVLSQARDIKGVKVLSIEVEGVDVKALREMAEAMLERLGEGIVVLGTTRDGKAHLAACVSKDLRGRFHAGKLVKAAAETLGGSGGGREDFAQAGGSRPERLAEALEKVYSLVESG